MLRLNVIIIDQSEQEYAGLLNAYKSLFPPLGYEVFAEFSQNGAEARRLIRSRFGDERIHMVVSDIAMGEGTGNGERKGFIWIQDIKTEYPDIFVIANSGEMIRFIESSAKQPGCDMFVDKILLSNGKKIYLESLRAEFSNKFKINTNITISSTCEFSSKAQKEFGDPSKNRDLCSLISQIVDDGVHTDYLSQFDSVELKSLDGGYSSSLVFEMRLSNTAENLEGLCCILKVAPNPKDAAIEANNYKRYAKWMLPYKWRVELLGEGVTHKYGAVCYAFLNDGIGDIEDVTKRLKSGDLNVVDAVIDKIFSPDKQTWYKTANCKPNDTVEELKGVSFTKHYLRKFFPSDTAIIKAQNLFGAECSRLLSATLDEKGKFTIPNLNTTIDNPFSKLFSAKDLPYLTCISHGDLNSNNILFSNDDEMVFIDFHQTGRQHVFIDFITFENSLRIYYPEDTLSVEEKVRFEGMISDFDRIISYTNIPNNLPNLYKKILKIRHNAHLNFPKEYLENYLRGTAISAIRLLRAEIEDDKRQRLLCLLFSAVGRI